MPPWGLTELKFSSLTVNYDAFAFFVYFSDFILNVTGLQCFDTIIGAVCSENSRLILILLKKKSKKKMFFFF